jgi:hypothetical protein
MEPDSKGQIMPQYSTNTSSVCSVCHQPILPQYYFCPNCGAKLNVAPLSTSVGTQVWIYAFSIILPMICFIFVTKWPGIKYFKSKDPNAKLIGQIAWMLIIFSTIMTVWFAVVWTQNYIKSTVNSINTDLNSYNI